MTKSPNSKQAKNDCKGNDESNYKQEVRIGLTTLVAGLGLIKLENLEKLVIYFHQLLSQCITPEQIKPLRLLLSVSSLLSYIIYVACLGFAIIGLYRSREYVIRALMMGVISFFLSYILMLILMLDKVVNI